MILYLIPDAVDFIGIENKLPANYSPKISIENGINNFAKWYKNYYGYS